MKQIEQFNNWFNNKFGWFFINGRKRQTKASSVVVHYVQADDLKNVAEVLDHVKEQPVNLEIEVVAWALLFMKENPELTITEAITMGYDEWIK